jgi:hypothetical protein
MPTIRFDQPFIGVNKNLDPSEIDPMEAEDALNLVLDKGTPKKRNGWTQQYDFTAKGAILGIAEYKRLDGTLYRLIKAGTTLQAVNAGTGVVVEIATGLHATNHLSVAVVNDKAYFCDGAVFKVTDGSGVHPAQIPRPGSLPTLAAIAGSGVLRGTYDYKITFYSATWGQESPASDASAALEITSQNTRLSSIPTSGDGRVTARRIYRRKVSASEAEWSLVTTLADNVTTTYDDTKRDNDVSDTEIAPLSFTDALPAFKYMAFQGGVLFLTAGDTTLYFTRADRFWEVDDSLTIGSEGDTDNITALHAWQGLLVVNKERSIWTLSGNSQSTFYPRKIWSGVGCRSQFSIVEHDEVLYWIAERGFYAFDGSRPVEMSDKIRPDLATRNFSKDTGVVGVHDFQDGIIWWSFAGNGSMVNNKAYAFSYRNSVRAETPSWCPWGFAGQEVTSLALLTDATSQQRDVFIGFRSGRVGKYAGNADNAGNIEAFWRTGRQNGGIQERFKRWGEVTVEATKQGSSSVVAVRRYLDDEAAPTLIANHDHTDPLFRNRVSRSSREIRLELYSNTQTPWEVTSMTLEAELAGRA